jgi:hypothetical protein
MIITTLLSKSIRDAQGRLHKRDERLTIVSRLPRADFDTRPLLRVRFEDGSTGVVFSEEVQLSFENGCLVMRWIRFGALPAKPEPRCDDGKAQPCRSIKLPVSNNTRICTNEFQTRIPGRKICWGALLGLPNRLPDRLLDGCPSCNHKAGAQPARACGSQWA